MTSVGHPATVVLVPGLCSTADELLPVQLALMRAGHAVWAPDIPGYTFSATSSQQAASPYRSWWQTLAAVARRACEDRRDPTAPVVLVGLSAGAGVVLGALLEAGPPVDGLVLLSTVLRTDGWAIPWYQFLLPLALYTPLGHFWSYRERPPFGVKNERVRSLVVHELELRRVSSAGAAVLGADFLREHDRMRRHLRRAMGRVRAPHVLAVHSRQDEVASLDNLVHLRRGLQAKSFQEVVLENSYHMVTIDNDRPRVVSETIKFIDGLVAQGAVARGGAGV